MDTALANVLFPGYRRGVLGLLLLHPENSYHQREIARLTGTTSGTLARELAKLVEAGLLTRSPRGNQVLYAANTRSPVFEELASILRKTSGLADVLAQALLPLAERIRVAFVFGSNASGKARTGSDVDVLLIGEGLGYGEVVTALYPAQETLGREINPKLYSPAEWQKLAAGDGTFYREVMAKPKLFLIGGEDELG
ncbi:DNA polymerase subunit beta [Stenotrophomonas daejeonensis]|uniref:DNA polymerase subunit beta n=1 Tax=Stenotrophomonas daejeonensis TaxID=659018 RepID=A0A0R0DR57_9GAMM|nr:nucleotidyltransferase domain-containing protein [Stenotrophomonas daejeonensis]KRG84347.1 DNA polymerase subunit beta [Stenotrophomonas daejeonensis]